VTYPVSPLGDTAITQEAPGSTCKTPNTSFPPPTNPTTSLRPSCLCGFIFLKPIAGAAAGAGAARGEPPVCRRLASQQVKRTVTCGLQWEPACED